MGRELNSTRRRRRRWYYVDSRLFFAFISCCHTVNDDDDRQTSLWLFICASERRVIGEEQVESSSSSTPRKDINLLHLTRQVDWLRPTEKWEISSFFLLLLSSFVLVGWMSASEEKKTFHMAAMRPTSFRLCPIFSVCLYLFISSSSSSSSCLITCWGAPAVCLLPDTSVCTIQLTLN